MSSEIQAGKARAVSSLLMAVALGLALWLALVKWRSLPCLGGGCDRVIQSRYGAIFGVPVGAFGAALWMALVFPLSDRLRCALHAVLGLGALGFMFIQFGVLQAFCPYCTVHAITAMVAWRWRHVRPAWWALALGVVLAGGGYLLAQWKADQHAAGATRPAALATGVDALFPFANSPPGAGPYRVLVLSATCPACLDLLGDVINAPWPATSTGPALYVKSEARDRALAAAWLAACREPAGSTPRDRFLAVTAMLVAQRELVTADPAAAAVWLTEMFRPSEEARRLAGQLLDRHAARLAEAGVITTPWFLPLGGPARTRVTAAELGR